MTALLVLYDNKLTASLVNYLHLIGRRAVILSVEYAIDEKVAPPLSIYIYIYIISTISCVETLYP